MKEEPTSPQPRQDESGRDLEETRNQSEDHNHNAMPLLRPFRSVRLKNSSQESSEGQSQPHNIDSLPKPQQAKDDDAEDDVTREEEETTPILSQRPIRSVRLKPSPKKLDELDEEEFEKALNDPVEPVEFTAPKRQSRGKKVVEEDEDFEFDENEMLTESSSCVTTTASELSLATKSSAINTASEQSLATNSSAMNTESEQSLNSKPQKKRGSKKAKVMFPEETGVVEKSGKRGKGRPRKSKDNATLLPEEEAVKPKPKAPPRQPRGARASRSNIPITRRTLGLPEIEDDELVVFPERTRRSRRATATISKPPPDDDDAGNVINWSVISIPGSSNPPSRAVTPVTIQPEPTTPASAYATPSDGTWAAFSRLSEQTDAALRKRENRATDDVKPLTIAPVSDDTKTDVFTDIVMTSDDADFVENVMKSEIKSEMKVGKIEILNEPQVKSEPG